jgi:hypothetical protein
MSFITAALIGGGASLLSGVMGAGAASDAAGQAAQGNAQALAAQQGMFNTVQNRTDPYSNAGAGALTKLNSLMGIGSGGTAGTPAGTSSNGQTYQQYLAGFNGGQQQYLNNGVPKAPAGALQDYGMGAYAQATTLPSIANGTSGGSRMSEAQWNAQNPGTSGTSGTSGSAGTPGLSASDPASLMHQFNASDLNSNLAPNYQFQLDQGLGATRNSANLQSGLVSGNAMMAGNNYAQNFAGNAYQNAFNNYNTNQGNIYNRLSGIAGIGTQANQTLAGAASGAANGISNAAVGMGNANAAGTMGVANSLSNGLNGAAGYYNMSQMMNAGVPVAGAGMTSTYNPNTGSYNG